MSELYFGYASFVYFVSKGGYTLQSHVGKQLTFWIEGRESSDEYDPYQIKYNTESDCGCVVVNSSVFDERFNNDNSGLVKTLKKCERKKRAVYDKITKREKTDIPHCYEPGHKTTIRNEEVECKRYIDE